MCKEIDDIAASIAARHALRDYWRRTTALERAVLAAVRMGYIMAADNDKRARDPVNIDARRIAAAVLAVTASNRGLTVDGVLIDDDREHGHWHVLVELDGGNRTFALLVDYPS